MDHTDTPRAAADDYGPNTRLIRGFLRRLEALDLEDLGAAIRSWREDLSDGWHEADHAVAAAIRDTDRHPAQEAVLEALYDVFRREPWFTEREPGTRVASSDATAQYIATSALLALLVCDRLPARYLETLYSPFAAIIPLADLERPSDDGVRHASGPDDRARPS